MAGGLRRHPQFPAQTAQLLISLLWVIPTGLGALLGVALTAGEIERRSAQVSWALARSRLRWLVVRAVPVAVMLAVVLAVAAGFADLATRGRLMTDDVGFHDYQLRSLLVPARGLLALGIGLAVGALLGRMLPALLVAAAFSAAVTAGVLVLVDAWHVTSATFVAIDDRALGGGSYPLVSTPSAVAGLAGDGVLLIPASEYWVWMLREGGLLVAAAAAAVVLAIVIVQRRSP